MLAKFDSLIENDRAAAALAGLAGAACFAVATFAGLSESAVLALEGAGAALLSFVPLAVRRAMLGKGAEGDQATDQGDPQS
ncbi:MAG: hypothetical protein KAQ88_01370, partial [Hyphomicrobiaceae bacterium]|nr:hypothetical protein [Hyphomicrobiaceae bacterium]